MCGFIFTHSKKQFTREELLNANTFIKFRGPTRTSIMSIQVKSGMHISMLHNLLDISGQQAEQPVMKDDSYLLFNGEIYNYKELNEASSDTYSLMNYYVTNGKFGDALDGEFVVLVYDSRECKLKVITDPFLTKPVFFGRSDDPAEFACASYPSALRELGFHHILNAQPNTTYEICLSNASISMSENYPTHVFNINQHVKKYDDWCDAFIEAVRKRAKHGSHAPFMALSSGYDSGCIALALKLLNIKFNTYTMMIGENHDVINDRYTYLGDLVNHKYLIQPISKSEISKLKSSALERIENISYYHDDGSGPINLISDPGSLGAYLIAQRAFEEGETVNLSGSGGDEIYSDYGSNGKKFIQHSEFGGLYPDVLQGFFPWKKFYGNTQRSYLLKEELVYGAFGIESRYPFLDKSVVDQFLILSSELKNACYKAPLDYFLKKYDFPFEQNTKRGFSIKKPPLPRRLRQYLKSYFKRN